VSNDNSNSNGVQQLPGGVLSFQIGNPANTGQDERIASDILRSGVHDGGSYRTGANGEVEKFGAMTFHKHDNRPAPDADPISTIRQSWGGAVRGDATDADVITFEGVTTTIGGAIRNGWLVRNGGSLAVTGKHVAELAALRGAQ
jgi:hypothetical protein